MPMKINLNPFIHGRAVTPLEFIGRELELRRILGRLLNRESSAIIGESRCGKTSLLKYIFGGSWHRNSPGDQSYESIFSYLDAQALRSIQTHAGFWECALAPLVEALKLGQESEFTNVKAKYELAQKNGFGTFVLEQLFKGLAAVGSRLALLLDEFDDFLSHPALNSAEFYGGLRSLASRSEGLVLVIAARRNLEQLNQLTQQINPHGSPYFNIFIELQLGRFSDREVTLLLDRADGRFSHDDRQFIIEVSGQHPYLVQATSAALWDAYEEGVKGTNSRARAGTALYLQAKNYFAETWKSWSNSTRRAVTAVALSQIPSQLGDHKFRVKKLLEGLGDYVPELRMLSASGFCLETSPGEWTITSRAFLWWLVDEIVKNVRDETEFNNWLQAQEMDWLLTEQQRQHFGEAAKGIMATTGKGVTALIEAFAKSVGESIT